MAFILSRAALSTSAYLQAAPIAFRRSAAQTSSVVTLSMAQNRGLEKRGESATPSEGGMTLYLKAGPDGTSVGDCPFAHFVRMVLEEKCLEYSLKPSTAETKPKWLVEYYEGKMPALRHRKECYVESDVIAEYLDFFFRDRPLKPSSKEDLEAAEEAVAGLFPSIAKYLKHTPDGDDEDLELKANLEASLRKLDNHLKNVEGPYVTGPTVSIVDCSLAPKLYHMEIGLGAFKGNAEEVMSKFPSVTAYMKAIFSRESFQKTLYPTEVVTWGWGNARN